MTVDYHTYRTMTTKGEEKERRLGKLKEQGQKQGLKIEDLEEDLEEALERVKKVEKRVEKVEEAESEEEPDKANSGSEMEKMASTLRDIREDIKFWKEM